MRLLAQNIGLALAVLVASTADATPPASPWSSSGNPVVTAADDQLWIAAARFEFGGVLVAWSDGRHRGLPEADIYAQALTFEGRVAPGWPKDGVPICRESGLQRSVAVVTDAGGAYIAWVDQRSNTDAVYLQRVTNEGAIATGWPAGGLLVAADAWAQSHRLVSDDAGGVFVGWSERPPAGPAVVKVQRFTPAGSTAPGWPAGGVSLGVQQYSSMALLADGSGGTFVSWSTPGDRDAGRTMVQRLASDGSVHPAWPAAGVVLGAMMQSQHGAHELISDDAGGVFAAWQQFGICIADIVPCGDQWITRLDGSGAAAPGWTLAGRHLGIAGTVVSDGAGGILYAWQQGGYTWFAPPSLHSTFKVMRLDGSGERRPGWQSMGNPICSEEDFQTAAHIVRDGSGGAYLGWVDSRTYEPVLYSTRLDGTGAVAHRWPVTGSLAAPAAKEMADLVVVDVGVGRAMMVWADKRYGTFDVFARPATAGPAGPPKSLAEVFDGSAQFGIVQMRPNPTSGTFWAIIGLSEAGHATLELFDLAGRIVEEQVVGPAGPARGAVRFNAAHRMKPGVYWLRLRQGSRSATARVVVAD